MSGHNNMQGRQLAIGPGLLVQWVTASATMPTAACTCHSVHTSGCHYCYHWQMVNYLKGLCAQPYKFGMHLHHCLHTQQTDVIAYVTN